MVIDIEIDSISLLFECSIIHGIVISFDQDRYRKGQTYMDLFQSTLDIPMKIKAYILNSRR